MNLCYWISLLLRYKMNMTTEEWLSYSDVVYNEEGISVDVWLETGPWRNQAE